MTDKLKVALAIPKRREIVGMQEFEFFLKHSAAEIFVLPEKYLHSDLLDEAKKMAKKNVKWIITGMDDMREHGKKYETAVVIDTQGKIVGEHKKTSLAPREIANGYSRGDSIELIETDFGPVGIAICYEFHHLPEVATIYTVKGARIIFTLMNYGAYNEAQYQKITSIACARAAENGVFVFGCSHFDKAIPFAYAYAPSGECLLRARDTNRLIEIEIDLCKYKMEKDLTERRPDLYQTLVDESPVDLSQKL